MNSGDGIGRKMRRSARLRTPRSATPRSTSRSCGPEAAPLSDGGGGMAARPSSEGRLCHARARNSRMAHPGNAAPHTAVCGTSTVVPRYVFQLLKSCSGDAMPASRAQSAKRRDLCCSPAFICTKEPQWEIQRRSEEIGGGCIPAPRGCGRAHRRRARRPPLRSARAARRPRGLILDREQTVQVEANLRSKTSADKRRAPHITRAGDASVPW